MKLPSLHRHYVGAMMGNSDHGINLARWDGNTMDSLGIMLALGECGRLVECTLWLFPHLRDSGNGAQKQEANAVLELKSEKE